MNINPITNDKNFQGKLIVKNKISCQQNYLFNLHKPNLEKMIEGLPFDLFVEQSKSKKTITLSTNVPDTYSYFVRKNKQNFEETAGYAISDAKKKSEIYQKMVRASVILENIKQHMIYVIDGKFKDAREVSKKIAELGVKDFDTYKSMTNFRITNLPTEVSKILFLNSIKYKIYRAFVSKTPEEHQLYKLNKQYKKEIKAQNKKIEPTLIKFPVF